MAHIDTVSCLTRGTIPGTVWADAWPALTSWKGHLHSIEGFVRLRSGGRRLENGDVRIFLLTTWEHTEQLEAWLEGPWPAERVLAAFSEPAYDVSSELMEDLT